MRQNVTDSFGDYALNIELDRLDELSGALAGRYRERPSWDFLAAGAEARRQWLGRELARLQRQRPVAPPVAPNAPADVLYPSQPPVPPAPPVPPLPPLPPQ